MPSDYVPSKTLKSLKYDLRNRLQVEPLDWVFYDKFLARLALKFDVSINTIEKQLEPYILNEDVIISTNEGNKKIVISRLAKKKKEEEARAYELELKKDLEESPGTKEDTFEYLKKMKVEGKDKEND